MRLLVILLISIFPVPVFEKYSDGEFVCASIEQDVNFVEDRTVPAEGYVIEVNSSAASVRYSDSGGLFYARQTLKEISAPRKDGTLSLRCCNIEDYPRVPWRGFMLDSGRQYQSPRTIKHMLDMMASLKMNVFHWHLTEGLGWRIEIKKYPGLTEKGAFVAGGPEQQGFYTQEEIREIVSYASERNITAVPEIDMPGHAEAALNAYPRLSCFKEAAEIPETGFTQVIFCAGKNRTLRFLKDVLDEICDLFPSEYIHLGGDEALKGNWDSCPDCARRMRREGLEDSHELQMWFSARMADHLKKKGRKAIFWEDVVHGSDFQLPDNVAIQWWNYRGHGDLAVKRALEKGYELICSPNYYTYLNFPTEPWKGYAADRTFSLKDAYYHNPLEDGIGSDSPLVLGGECALWTDYGLIEEMLDERLFPRIYAIAQILWSERKVPIPDR